MKGKILYVGNYDISRVKNLLLGGGTIIPVFTEERSVIGEMFKNIDWSGFVEHAENLVKDAPKFYDNYYRKDKNCHEKKSKLNRFSRIKK